MSAKGYRLDYSIDSVREVERLFAEHAPNGVPKKGGMFEYDGLNAELFGYYVGEVLLKHKPGRWQEEPNPAIRPGRRFRLHFDDGSIADPVSRVERYAKTGEGAGVLVSYVRAQAEAPKR